jgi:hypothetical protein
LLRRSAPSPNPLDPVSIEGALARDKRKIAERRLGDQHAAERIASLQQRRRGSEQGQAHQIARQVLSSFVKARQAMSISGKRIVITHQ